MDLARDLIDHRIADLEDQDAGMVDDIWITWQGDRATLGPLVTGTAALLSQLGALGACLSRVSRHIGWSHARIWRELAWTDVRRIEHPQVKLVLRRTELPPPLHTAQPQLSSSHRMLYSQLSNLPVMTRDHRRLAIIDVRTEPLVAQPPEVLGLIIGPHPRRRTLGLKRFDTTTIRLGAITRGACFLAWSAITSITHQAIYTNAASGELPALAAAPAPQTPPMPEGPTPP